MKSCFIAFGLSLLLTLPMTGLAQEQPKVNLDFHDVDIQDVVRSISEITGRNFIIGPRVRGKISIISPTPVSIDDAYQVFLLALKAQKFCVEKDGVTHTILPIRECTIGKLESARSKKNRSGGFVTRVIELKYITANEMATSLRPLISKSGTVTAYGPTNTLMITDFSSNIDQIMGIIGLIDRPTNEETVETIPIQYGNAGDIAQMLEEIFSTERSSKRRSRSSRRSGDVEAREDVTKIIPVERTNSIIITATRKGLERVIDLVQKWDVPNTKARGKIHIKKLRHAKALELAEILSGLLSGSSSSRKAKRTPTKARPASTSSSGLGSSSSLSGPEDRSPVIVSGDGAGLFKSEIRVAADPSINALIITAEPSDYETLEPLIDELDTPRPQVLVETLIMEVNLNRAREVGFSGHGGAEAGGATLFGGTQFQTESGSFSSVNPGAAAAGSGLLLGGMDSQKFKIPGLSIPGMEDGIPLFGGLFRALQTENVLNVLSAPHILAKDNTRAEILVGREVPFTTTKGRDVNNNPIDQVERKKIGIQLAVTPQINDGDEVTLEVEQKIQEVEKKREASVSGLTTSERSAKTTVIARDGQTIVIGGLIREKEEETESKVPLLGDIPLLGYLFRDTAKTREKTNLIIFLTPHIIREPEDLTRISVKKNNERRKFYKKHGIGENRALYDYDLDKGLNMAPRTSPKVRRERTPKKRFDYDQPIESEVPKASDGDVLSERISPTNSVMENESDYATYDHFDSNASIDLKPAPKGPSANPFVDIQPPSSN